MRAGAARRPRIGAWLGAYSSVTFVVTLVLVVPVLAENDRRSPAELATELRATQQQMRELQRLLETQQREMRRQLDELQRKVDSQARVIETLQTTPQASAAQTAPALTVPPPVTAGAAAPTTTARSTEQPTTTTTAWSPEQPIRVFGSGQAYLNLSFDALADFGWSTTPDVEELQLGDHDPLQRGFTIPNTEIVVEGAVDPYFKGLADVVFKLGPDNETEVELEEAYLMTTSLPWNLQVKGGQFLTEFGRQNQQHPHAWDFVDLPLVLARILGPEGLRNPGARLSWLAPTPFYSEAFLTLLDSQGGTAASFRNDEDERFGRAPIETKVHSVGDLLFVPRYAASFDLTPSQTLVAGLSGAFGPNATGNNTDTQIYGADLYWKWKPEWQSAGWPFVSFQTEGLYRRFEAGSVSIEATDTDPGLFLPRESLHDYGFYAQALYGFRRRWVAGLRGEYVTGDQGAFRPDPDRADRFRLSPNLTFYPTEFSKLRLQWNYDHGRLRGDDHSVWLQTEFLLGSHAAHKF